MKELGLDKKSLINQNYYKIIPGSTILLNEFNNQETFYTIQSFDVENDQFVLKNVKFDVEKPSKPKDIKLFKDMTNLAFNMDNLNEKYGKYWIIQKDLLGKKIIKIFSI